MQEVASCADGKRPEQWPGFGPISILPDLYKLYRTPIITLIDNCNEEPFRKV
jgi:hypothetical protein